MTAAASFAMAPLGAGATPTDAPPTPESLEVAAEHYNLARLKVDRATAALDATDRRIADAQARVLLVRTRARARAAALYQGTTIDSPLAIGESGQFADAHRRSRYLDAAERPDRTLVQTLSVELDHLAVERASQRDVRELLQRNVTEADRAKRALQSLAAEAAARGVRATGDGAGPLATTALPTTSTPRNPAPNAPPATAGVPVTTTTTVAHAPTPQPTSSPPSQPPASGTEPPVSPGAATAVAFARAQLGKPYVFNTAGPNTYDCSGLTMAAWAAAGVRMPHYSGSQATIFPRVTWEQLKPGDLVLFYSDLHHVGLYIGGGMMIHAPQTGDVVKIAPAWRSTFMWGVRPH